MRKIVLVSVAAWCLAAPAMAQPKKDAPSCNDHPLLTRLPDYWIESCVQKQFDAYKFNVGKGQSAVEGKFWNIRYQPPAGLTTKPSTLQVLRNVEAAIKKVGGVVVASDSSKETLKLTNEGKELWVEVWADYTGKYILTIVEKAAMAQEIVANAEAFANDLRRTGHIAVEGIFFDTGRAELKPESQQRSARSSSSSRRTPCSRCSSSATPTTSAGWTTT